MANQWFRLYAEFASDPKVQMMDECMQRRLIMIFCMRCSNSNETLQDSEVAFHLRISDTEWQKTKALFLSKNFIDKDNKIVNWYSRQYESDSSTPRVRRYREKKKSMMEREGNVTVTDQTRTEQNRIKDSCDSSEPRKIRVPVSKIIEIYNQALGEYLPRVQLETSKRKSLATKRWNEMLNTNTSSGKVRYDDEQTGLDWWRRLFCKVKLNPHWMGENDRGWKADFDWIMNANNFPKILEYTPKAQ